jgi:cob(I)alamin adenosyltransferase
MLYTRKGDKGTTKLFDCPQGTRLSKSEYVFEVLGMLDELNSSLGYARALANQADLFVGIKNKKIPYGEILFNLQQNLFCIQAEVGGSKMHTKKEHILFLEEVIYEIETLLPPIHSFIVPGEGLVGAYLDVARTMARRAERGLVILKDQKERSINDLSLEYLNRLSSVLYALARFANYQDGCVEKKPDYK